MGNCLWNFIFLWGRGGLALWDFAFLGVEGPCALELFVFAELSDFSCLSFWRCCHTYFFLGRGCDTNFTLWREDSILCFDCLLVFILFSVLPSRPFILYFCCGATCRCQNLHTFSHTPTPLAPAVNLFVVPPGNKVFTPSTPPLPPELEKNFRLLSSNKVFILPSTHPPLPPALNIFGLPPSNKVFTPSTHPPSHRHLNFFLLLSSNKVFILPSTHPPPPPPPPSHRHLIFFVLPPSNKVFTPSTHPPSHRHLNFFLLLSSNKVFILPSTHPPPTST